MKFTRVYLRDFIPLLFLSNIKEIDYTPQQVLQIILGSNGSGKSSLLRAFSLANLDRKEFGKEGLRILEGVHEGISVKLESDYSGSSPKHSFIYDGMEYNDGGTSKIQNELVNRYFGYTSFIHELISGKMSFTDMSPVARKDLLIKISGLDLDYALSIFDELKSRHRDTIGATKHVIAKFTDASTRFASLGDIEGLDERATGIEVELSALVNKTNMSLLHDPMTDAKLDKMEGVIDAAVNVLLTKIKRINTVMYKNKVDLSPFKDVEGLSYAVGMAKEVSIQTRNRIAEKQDQLTKVENQIHLADAIPEDVTTEKLKLELTDLIIERDASKVDISRLSDATPERKIALFSLMDKLKGVFSGMPDGIPAFTRTEVSELKEWNIGHLKTIAEFDFKDEKLAHHLSHIEVSLSGTVVCKNCDSKIYANDQYTDELAARVTAKLSTLRQDRDTYDRHAIPTKKRFEESKEFVHMMSVIAGIVRSHSIVQDVMNEIGGPGSMLANPLSTIHQMEKAIASHESLVRYDTLIKEIKEHDEYIVLLTASEGDNVVARFRTLETELERLYDEVNKQDDMSKLLAGLHGVVADFLMTYKDLHERLLKPYFDYFEKVVTEGQQHLVNQHVKKQQSYLASLRSTLADYETLALNLETLKADEEALILDKQALTVLLKTLSPKTGLIGEQLNLAIGGFVDRVNQIVGLIWEYDLEINRPVLGEPVDYKFKTFIDGKEGPEIKDLSTGQKDVINLASTLVVMTQLGLDNFPLFLDEVGSSFDERHRENLMTFIKDIVTTGRVSSVFLISHYASTHNAFANSDIIVLNPDNIAVPLKNFNEVVTFT